MSVYSSIDTPDEFDDGPYARPYVDVAHDNGGYDAPGGRVRLIIGRDIGHAAHVHLSPAQAHALSDMLHDAADRASDTYLSGSQPEPPVRVDPRWLGAVHSAREAAGTPALTWDEDDTEAVTPEEPS